MANQNSGSTQTLQSKVPTPDVPATKAPDQTALNGTATQGKSQGSGATVPLISGKVSV